MRTRGTRPDEAVTAQRATALRRHEAPLFPGGRPLATPATLTAVQRTAGNTAARHVVARSARSGTALPVQRAADETAAEQASKKNSTATRAFAKGFANFVYSHDNLSFDEAYWEFTEIQKIYTHDVFGDAGFQKNVKDQIWERTQKKINDYKKEARPMNIPEGDPVRLYRKMSALEAEVFLKPKSAKAGIVDSMKARESKQYRKYFTTSLVHTAKFSNENAADADNEKVLEFTIPAADYWNFFQKYAQPNQKAGAFDRADSAVVNQEGLRVGPEVNFLDDNRVKEVLQKKTHHNIGIGGGNVADFAKIATRVAEVEPSRVESAIAASRASMAATLAL
ncbi:hypothetical protein [Streptomyces sp. WG7]|uniref:hypothetical protein n=1 Tax=Streptomyces sp. WG7 TaxID=3417650 RepID=UPI003CF2419E